MNNFKVMNPVMFVFYDTIANKHHFNTERELKTAHKNSYYYKKEIIKEDGQPKKIMYEKKDFIDTWLKDENMRTYDYINFLPMQEAPENVYNTFKGYAAEKKKLYEVNINESCIIKHIKNICGNNNDVFNLFLHVLALLIKKPYLKSRIAIIFKSIEGTGKDLLFNWIGNNIIGSEYYLNTEKTNLIFGRFTSSIENKILIIINETSGKDTGQIMENIKNAITEEKNIIEHKGMKPYEVNNYIQYFFF